MTSHQMVMELIDVRDGQLQLNKQEPAYAAKGQKDQSGPLEVNWGLPCQSVIIKEYQV